MDNLKKLKEEHKAAIAGAVATIAMTSTPVFAGPLDDLATAATSIGSLTGTIGAAAVVATGISVGLVMFRRATGR